MDILIKNGIIITPHSSFKADLGISNEKICEISQTGTNKNADIIIDAEGKYIFPGVIDVHTHLELPYGDTFSSDDFENGTKAGAFGGVTTIIDFAVQEKGQSLNEALNLRKKIANPKVYVDYALHIGITDLRDEIIKEIEDVIDSGSPSFKLFTTYRQRGLMLDDGSIFDILESASKYGGLVGVHAENNFIIESRVNKFLKEGKIAPIYHARSRPQFAECEAIERMIKWTKETNGNLYIFHLSTAGGVEAVAKARDAGVKVFAETCPHYLVLSDKSFERKDGHHYLVSPPLRSDDDIKALWRGLQRDDIQVVATDHCPFNTKQKSSGDGTFATVPNGLPGIETLLPIMYTEGVGKKRISLNRLVELLSTNPAKIFGLSNKGSLDIGSDADIVIFDPDKEVTISYKNLQMNVDWNPYEGMKLKGYPITTISRGRIIYDNGKFLGEKGRGKFIKRFIKQ